MIGISESLRSADERWARRTSGSVWSAAAIVAVAWGLIALNRLGGLSFTDPRAFVRVTLTGIWGWLALGACLWLVVRVSTRAAPTDALDDADSSVVRLERMLCVVGWAHTPIVVLAIVVFIAAGVLQILGPGLVVATVVFALFVPFALVTGVRHVAGSSIVWASAIVAIPYVVWLLVVVRNARDSIQHLL